MPKRRIYTMFASVVFENLQIKAMTMFLYFVSVVQFTRQKCFLWMGVVYFVGSCKALYFDKLWLMFMAFKKLYCVLIFYSLLMKTET